AQCCKILRAVASVATKSWTRGDAKFSEADCYYDERALITAYSQTTLAPLFLDTGPPGAHSFAELILQRSLLAHAPPSLAYPAPKTFGSRIFRCSGRRAVCIR